MPLLPSITSPADLRDLSTDQLPTLAGEIRDFLVHACARTGGHLGPNLGAVELTIALHRVFDSPREPILFDTGHQAYVHKLLTGRQDFTELRRAGGLSGYPSRAESEHDWIENSHASTALSYADGLAKAMAVRGESRPVVAVVGDGALTGGMCWEALNNIAGAKDRPVIVVVNDNGRSYSPTIGGLADSLATLRLRPGYENFLDSVKSALSRTPVVGNAVYDALHGMKKGLKDVVAPQGMFEDLGMKYVGPVDGHDLDALQSALMRAKDFGAPVIVHCVTTKGFGYQPAESDEEDAWHSRGAFDPTDGSSTSAAAPTWTEAFSDELVRLGGTRPDLVAITAAMLHPTGLAAFAEKFPTRTYDVGIAEQHAVASAAGLAMGGLHPVVAIYATFLNRAFDQVLLDVAMHRLPVTFVLDRAGVTGEDGASHNGMWDLSLLGIVPGLRIAVPRDAPRLRTALGDAVAEAQAPTALRFPKGAVVIDQDPVRTIETMSGTGLDVLAEPDTAPHVDILVVALGPLCAPAVAATAQLAESGLRVRVVDPVWIRPVPPELIEATRTAGLVVTVEDGGRTGGFGSWVAEAMRDAQTPAELSTLGLDQEFLAVGARTALLAAAGLDAQGLVATITERWQRLAGSTQPGPEATTKQGTVVDLTRTDLQSRDPRRRSASS